MPRTLVARTLAATRTLLTSRIEVGEQGTPPVLVPGPTAPVLSNIQALSITQTSANISWSVDQPATGQVNYGLTAGYGSSTTAETSYDYSAHVQAISGLTAGTTYHYRVRSTNVSAQETVSGDQTFATLAAPPTNDQTGRRSVTPTLPAAGGTTTCGGSARTNVTITNLTYPTTDEGEAVSWRPTAGHLHTIADGTSESAAKAIIDAATSGTITNPCIIQFASGSTFNWDQRYYMSAPRAYIILWGYGAIIHSTGVNNGAANHANARSHFYFDSAGGTGYSNHHIKILGFELKGTHTNAGTTSAYGTDAPLCISLLGICEDFEIADVYIHNVWSDGIYLHGDAQSYPRCKRVSIHHNFVDKCGRQNLTLNQCEDLWVLWNWVRDSAMYLIDVEDARHANQDQLRYYIRDNLFENWCWDKAAFGASYFNQNAVAFVNNRAVPSFTSQASDMSCTYIYFERNTFLGGPKGWGSDTNIVYAGEPGTTNRYNEVIAVGVAAWTGVGANSTVAPKTNIYVRDNDLSGVPVALRAAGGISVTYATTVEITGNNLPGYSIYNIGNTSVTLSGNTSGSVKTAWP